VPGGLTGRMVVASGLLATVIGAAFAVLLRLVVDHGTTLHINLPPTPATTLPASRHCKMPARQEP
jgi:hypothetical protein